ncbi:MAG: metallophosphoesterase family protein [Candidatus Omnitrophica bacterium]|nr:metallophosphoesterase family protein [Candidatus Omnitrophota bacterium]
MKYGIFSDVHSNFEAFEAVLKALEEERVDQYVFLGDIIGYGAQPKECLQLLKGLAKNGCLYVAGNHDYAACGKAKTDRYVRYAIESLEWTRGILDDDDLQFLAAMPLVQQVEDFTIAHANLEAPEKWNYILDIDDVHPNFQRLKNQICFIGHSHRPITFYAQEGIDWFIQDDFLIEEGVKYIINIGSVGQPRDGNPKASFAVYDSAKKSVQIKRQEYDFHATQKKILDAGLPKMLAERLGMGK